MNPNGTSDRALAAPFYFLFLFFFANTVKASRSLLGKRLPHGAVTFLVSLYFISIERCTINALRRLNLRPVNLSDIPFGAVEIVLLGLI
jgi:hypothetical protein